MHYYRVFRIFCYEKRKYGITIFTTGFILTMIAAYIENNELYTLCALSMIIFCPFFAVSINLPWNRTEITSKIGAKPRRLQKLTMEVIDRIKKLNGNRFHFTFKEYDVHVIGMRNSCSLLDPHIEKVYFRNVLLSRTPFRIFPDGHIVTLNEFFYKTVTKGDKAELEKVLFQII